MFDKVMHYYYLKRLLVKKSDLVSKKRYFVKKWHSLPAHLRIQISNEYSIFQSMKSSNKLKDPLYENKKRYPNVNDQLVSLMLIPSDKNAYKKQHEWSVWVKAF